ncbi:DNA primase [Acetohalobium arabaticum]|uniref:DNA primase n=1 Tax=Acetohalobium arabaticum (strain ATCC 49924 / DSM 5501 / Z-7288) TaxID=574087 RepID=D9QVH3_ACEAZ|nr:DNA primase [Acetohalobium arabaticum]ADL12232.1 DNA primase [Acetohalobium arabaticum DSM 5501]
MAYLNDEFIDKVRDNNDIIDVISDYTNLEKAGKNYKALCPFHDERTPSFMVNPEKQLYHCFGCGVGGNVFNFMMDIENLDFIEAVEILAQRIGLSLPERKDSSTGESTTKSEIYEIHNWAVKFFNYLLTETNQGSEAYEYLRQRGIKEETIDQFELGYAPDSWRGLFDFLRKKGYSADRIQQAGLIIPQKKGKGYYDRFRNRIIFTINNLRGQAIGFGGRVVDDSHPKYLNSPQTPVFNKKNILYGLARAKREIKRSGSVVIVEGYTDVITGHQFGIENIVASLGTSLTKSQARLLRRYADRVYIAYDGDVAGENATLRGFNILKNTGLEVYVVNLPVDQDPDEVIRSQGKEEFELLLSEAVSLIEFKLESLLTDRDLTKIEQKVEAVDDIMPVLAGIENEIKQAEYIKKIAGRLDVETGVIKSRLKKFQQDVSEQDRNYRDRNNKFKSDSKVDSEAESDTQFQFEKKLLELMIKDTQILNLVKAELDSDEFITDEYQSAAELIFDIDNSDWEELINKVNSAEIRQMITEVSLGNYQKEEINEYQLEEAKGYIKKIKEYQLKMKKERLDAEIEQHEASRDFAKVNQLLRERQEVVQLLQDPDSLLGNNFDVGKGGY